MATFFNPNPTEEAVMIRFIDVALKERAVVFVDGLPHKALEPGRHVVWGFGREVKFYKTSKLVFKAPTEVRAVFPVDWFNEVLIGPHERGILFEDGVPSVFLRPGVHRYWTVDGSVTLSVLSIDEPMPELTDELIAVISPHEYVDVLVHAHQMGLHYVQGRLVEVFEPGRYVIWQHAAKQVEVMCVDMRRNELTIAGQELMTRDKVTLRLTLAVDYAIVDPAQAMHAVANVRDAIYLQVQLVARDYVAGVSLDELLEGRDEMTRYLEDRAAPKAEAFGVRIERVGVKDVVLPGEMKLLLNRVIEADKEAAANVILRREETAATRSLANTAKVMADNPVLLRLKELESLKEIAGQIGEVRMVVGSDGLDKLGYAGLLNGGKGVS
jgi:regulator of protease activity HflC (stomatin/prohibitin superfamily)